MKSISNNTLSDNEQRLIALYHDKQAEKETLTIKINGIEKEIEELKNLIEENQAQEKIKNANLRNIEKQISELNISISKNDLRIDSMLNTLSIDYELTYEKAKKDYPLDVEAEEARIKVNTYKNNIKRIGMVNLDSIEEFEKVNTRFEFLSNQKNDLIKAEDT